MSDACKSLFLFDQFYARMRQTKIQCFTWFIEIYYGCLSSVRTNVHTCLWTRIHFTYGSTCLQTRRARARSLCAFFAWVQLTCTLAEHWARSNEMQWRSCCFFPWNCFTQFSVRNKIQVFYSKSTKFMSINILDPKQVTCTYVHFWRQVFFLSFG